ncbi:MAG: FliA/WhiG family RNA polymerase sigma factor [Myxococcales bacterium]|nr:FliA/WhiG family RNA polymerase sigma factor [Myxococcales bacterium]
MDKKETVSVSRPVESAEVDERVMESAPPVVASETTGEAGLSEVEKQDRNEAVIRYMPLIKRVISRLGYRFPPLMEEGDMVALGVIGLIDALERYEPGALAFTQYAEIRIRGAILDELRRADVLSRGMRRKARLYQRVEARLRSRLGRYPTTEEIATAMNCSVAEVEEMREQFQPVVFTEVETLDFASERPGMGGTFSARSRQDPQGYVQQREVKQKVIEALEKLPERQRLILYLYYFEELTLREIGEMLSLSESRICQIHQKACKAVEGLLSFDLNVLSEH